RSICLTNFGRLPQAISSPRDTTSHRPSENARGFGHQLVDQLLVHFRVVLRHPDVERNRLETAPDRVVGTAHPGPMVAIHEQFVGSQKLDWVFVLPAALDSAH